MFSNTFIWETGRISQKKQLFTFLLYGGASVRYERLQTGSCSRGGLQKPPIRPEEEVVIFPQPLGPGDMANSFLTDIQADAFQGFRSVIVVFLPVYQFDYVF